MKTAPFLHNNSARGSDLYLNPVSVADKLAWLGACPFISRAQFSHLFNGELSYLLLRVG